MPTSSYEFLEDFQGLKFLGGTARYPQDLKFYAHEN